jgi:arylsulfatase
VAHVAILLAALGAAVGGCRSVTGEGPPTLVLVSLDTTRADSCSLYGYARPTTPTLEALADGAIVFDAAISPSTWTLPAHASLWTGVYASQHGAVSSLTADGEWGRPLPPSLSTLPELLRESGYQTAGFVGGPFLTRRFGFARGFDHYDDRLDPWGIDAVEVNRRAAAWLRSERDARPLFLFVNYYDPHRPYAPPRGAPDPFVESDECPDPQPRDFDPATSGTLASPEDVACARIQYAREIRAADGALGELLDLLAARGELRRAVLAVVGDHGEAFGENGVWAHGGPGFLHQRRVPLLLRFYGGRRSAGRRLSEPVSTARLPRTLLELAGVPTPQGWLGPSLLDSEPAALVPLTERYTPELSFHALSFPRWTFMVVAGANAPPVEQIFRIEADGAEVLVPPGGWDPAAADASRHAWLALRAELGPLRRFEPQRPDPADPATREALRALGYLEGGPAAPTPPVAPAAPPARGADGGPP